jgi:hypothetical protein
MITPCSGDGEHSVRIVLVANDISILVYLPQDGDEKTAVADRRYDSTDDQGSDRPCRALE